MVKVWSFLAHPPQNCSPLKFWQNWTETIFQLVIFWNFTNTRDLDWWKCITWTKSDMPTIKSVYEKVWFTINGPSKTVFFNFFPLSFFQISGYHCRSSNGKTILFYNRSFFITSCEVLLHHIYFWTTIFWQWHDSFF